jgi:hypothetical protein
LPRPSHSDVAGLARAEGSASAERTGRRTLLLAAWALLLVAVFAVALRSAADDTSARAGDAKVAGSSAAVGR